MKRTVIYFLATALWLWGSGNTEAQNVVLEKYFAKFLNGYTDYPSPQGKTGLEGWSFNTCYILKDGNIQIGSSQGTEGTVTTEALTKLKGDALVLLEVHGNVSASFDVTALNKGSVTPTTSFSILKESNSFVTSYILTGGDASTKIQIKSKTDYFDFCALKIIDLKDCFFHESFNKMSFTKNTSTSMYDYYETLMNDGSLFDNSISIDGSEGIHKGHRCIGLHYDNTYTTPNLNHASSTVVVLSFRAAGVKNSNIQSSLTLSCKGGGTLYKSTFELAENKWNDYSVEITGITNSTQIEFKGSTVLLDDVMLFDNINLSLDESADNSTVIANSQGELRNVSLNRTLKGGIWNTLCLPFDVSAASIEATTTQTVNPDIRTFKEVDDTGVFLFEPCTGTVTAGYPFLVKVDADVVNPIFPDVTISATEPAALGNETYQLKGTFSPVTLNTNGTHLFLGTDGYLYEPAEVSNTMKGMRAYLAVPASSQGVRVDTGTGMSGISTPLIHTGSSSLYDLQGRRIARGTATRGLYVKDGRKVFVNK